MEEEFKLIMREPEFLKIGFQEGNNFFNQLLNVKDLEEVKEKLELIKNLIRNQRTPLKLFAKSFTLKIDLEVEVDLLKKLMIKKMILKEKI